MNPQHLLFCTFCGLNIKGLIIDAFGELRDQQEQVKEDMEVHKPTHTYRSFLLMKLCQFESCL